MRDILYAMCLGFYFFACFNYNFVSFQNLFFWCDISLASTEIILAALKLQSFSKDSKPLWTSKECKERYRIFWAFPHLKLPFKGINQRISVPKELLCRKLCQNEIRKKSHRNQEGMHFKGKKTTLLIVSPLWYSS